ncbi:nucleobase:cation symporter-2 family protein [Acinetobacter pollinis]|uniref:nucleobase:cation symporter-2 family protein n=1 Tax=Acinetobacter pollinis TaxID=2605270 RepID=UPI0018A25DF3|nr:nucleobase:cation symporter-2 family protein [Acinetobacter pollinis]MBF7689554.1 purine permease [Acinetobacter pollinis]MBF7698125.1 purine permease [Acinetobacter pollinis]
MKQRQIAYEDEYLGLNKSIAYGLQHVLTMYGGIVAPPLIVGSAIGLTHIEIGMLITASLFIGGLATLLQTLGMKWFGAKLPLVQGVSFAGVASMIAIGTTGGGFQTILGAVLASSLIGLIVAPFFSRIIRFFPPVVTGSVITIIGFSLLPVALNWIMGGNNKASNWGSLSNLGLAAFTLTVLLVFSRFGTIGLRRVAILLSIVIGTVFAYALGYCNFSGVADGQWLAIPSFLSFGMPIFSIPAIVAMCIVMIVTLTETTADILAVGEIVGSEVTQQRIANGLRADMLSSAIAPFFGTFMQSAFAQNVGLVAITGVKSRFVVAAGGMILILLGLFPIMGRFIAAIPAPVLGGAGIVLFGSVAASGIRTLGQVDFSDQKNLIIVAVALSAGMIPMINHDFFIHFPKWVQMMFHSGISITCVMAVGLNIFFNHLRVKKPISNSASSSLLSHK